MATHKIKLGMYAYVWFRRTIYITKDILMFLFLLVSQNRIKSIPVNNIPEDPNTNDTDVVKAILNIEEENIVNVFRLGPPPGLGTNSDRPHQGH